MRAVFYASALVLLVVYLASVSAIPSTFKKLRASAALNAAQFVEAELAAGVDVDVDTDADPDADLDTDLNLADRLVEADVMDVDAETDADVEADEDSAAVEAMDSETKSDAVSATTVSVSTSVSAVTARAVRVVCANPNIDIADNAAGFCTINLETGGGAAVPLNTAMVTPLRTCVALRNAMGAHTAANALAALDQTWIDVVAVNGGTTYRVGGNAIPSIGGGDTVVVRLHPLRRISVQIAGNPGGVAAMVGVVGLVSAQTYTAQVVTDLGAQVQHRYGGNWYGYGFTVADYNAGGGPPVGVALAAAIPVGQGDFTITFGKPERVTLITNTVNVGVQQTIDLLVPLAVAATFNPAFVAAVNLYAITAVVYADTLADYNGAGVAPGGVVALAAHPAASLWRLEHFDGGGFVKAMFPATLAAAHSWQINTGGTEHVVYFAGNSGNFAYPVNGGGQANVAAEIARAATGNVAHLNQIDPVALYGTLTADGGTVGSRSRVLKRNLEGLHGTSNVHWGFAYFLIDVTMHKTITTRSFTRQIGWLAAFDNVGGVPASQQHTEMRILEHLRLFTNALEAGGTGGVHLTVRAFQSRWTQDLTPDPLAGFNCAWAIQYVSLACANRWFRNGPYSEDIRQLGAKTALGINGYHGGHGTVQDAAPAITWNALVGRYVYYDANARNRATNNGARIPNAGQEDENPGHTDGYNF